MPRRPKERKGGSGNRIACNSFISNAVPAGPYYEQSNSDLLYRIPVNAKSVLEVGCGAGALGQAFKSINPNVIYIGVEQIPEAAAQARRVLDFVLERDISQQSITTLPGGVRKVDCIIFGDVLEHLIDPAKVLDQTLNFLEENGTLIACIPNVQHYSVIANLLSGQWPQKDQGLFDRTHLRWFTKQSIVDLLKEVGLKPYEITPRIPNTDEAIRFTRVLQPALEKLNINPETFLNGTAPCQYVVRASKKTVPTLEIGGLMLKPQAGMNEVRMIQPLRSVASLPGVSAQISSHSLKLLPANSIIPRIMIWQRQLLTYSDSLDRIRKVLKSGYILISEFDDDPDHWPAIQQNKNLNFTAMHAVQVSTLTLRDKLLAINPEVEVFSNCLEQISKLDPGKWTGAGTIKPLKIFFGALNRQESWEQWIDPLNQVLNDSQEAWHFEVIHDRAFFNALSTPHKSFTPTCNYTDYLSILKQSHIALLPLNSTPFNQQKSDLKFVEAAGCGVAAIASPTVYANTIQHNKTGFICESGLALKAALENWQAEPKQAQTIATAAHNWCATHRLQQQQSERRLEWYWSLWQRKEELTAALLQRVPELASDFP